MEWLHAVDGIKQAEGLVFSMESQRPGVSFSKWLCYWSVLCLLYMCGFNVVGGSYWRHETYGHVMLYAGSYDPFGHSYVGSKL
ncbi:hypothetical protein BO70DRAFT_361625 [Aspergillus heteromorphus CBS 117.55]|uniref:Uncharacterized protein n=1 Tax=Aspergillus heteromorphus CBS 117.55 TaxID=1448321 RepID=A0A317WES2_9EURO|nr:uncharacterized protein BO70DRAFT_361625 [Aspergillus heteromorphus CBS 117.55]PWY83508.1 hypothetical protein BO70DRAFT_361625 [Aspergillus heteromorphus CBS 117.55]